jgi:putative nucleotidyltransferase with HDIG domain
MQREMLAAQRLERESLYKNIEDSRKLLDESFEAQKEERKTLVQNIDENRKLLDRSFESQKAERKSFLQNIEDNRKIFDLNLLAQREERESLFRRIEENQRILDESMRAQQEEREFFLKNMMEISRSQKEDRRLFSRTLIILVGGSIFIAIIIFLGFVILLKRRTAQEQMIYHEPKPALDFKPDTLLEYTEKIDESKYITDERYTDMVKAKQLRDLYSELQKGNVSWDVVQGYVSELNHEVKSEILNIVEKKIKSGETAGRESAMEILLPFITDGDRDIGAKSKSLLRGIAGETLGELHHPEGLAGAEGASGAADLGDLSDPLSTGSLLQFARMADAKTGRSNHSVRVAEISFKIAQALEDPKLEPDTIRRVGLVHDIGYLELDDKIVKKEGKLTEKEFSIIKTHTERGLNLFHHVKLPKIFIDGITYHHERLDGSGYPKGLKGTKIPMIARLLAVADFFDAVTSARPHRPALTIGSAIKMMEKLVGEIFEKRYYDILLKLFKDQMEDDV